MPKKIFEDMTVAEVGAPGARAIREVVKMIETYGEENRAYIIAASLDAFTDLVKTSAGKLMIKLACLECQRAELN
jgi:hypothetical protein